MSSRMQEAYASALFDVTSPGGIVTLRVGHANVDPPPSMQARTLTVVTVFNPGDERPTEAENRRANDRLRAAICEASWSYWPAVMGIRFKQACVFYGDGEKGRLVWC